MSGIQFSPQSASNAENISIWWRHHDNLKMTSSLIPNTELHCSFTHPQIMAAKFYGRIALAAVLPMPRYPCCVTHAVLPIPCNTYCVAHVELTVLCYPCRVNHIVLPMPCYPCHVTHTLLPMSCFPCHFTHTVSPMRCHPYWVTHEMLPMSCYPYCIAHAMFPMSYYPCRVIDLRIAQVYCDPIFLVSQEVSLNFHHFCG